MTIKDGQEFMKKRKAKKLLAYGLSHAFYRKRETYGKKAH